MSTITIGIPNYSRPEELEQLLESILSQTDMPDEVLICDDCSPDWKKIERVIDRFASNCKGAMVNIIRKSNNEGYDANLRELVKESHSDYLLLIGNDDLLVNNCIAIIRNIVAEHKYAMYSRSFFKFTSTNGTFALSRQYFGTQKVTQEQGSAVALMLSAYVGGLLIDTKWARRLETKRFDGTLYYQVYLALTAFLQDSFFYIDAPTVSARSDGAPLFGQNKRESDHVPGRYTADGRIKMWKSLLEIESFVFKSNRSISVKKNFKKLISGRFSFHIFESYSNRGRYDLIELYFKLLVNGYGYSVYPHLFFIAVFLFGRRSEIIFYLIRQKYQGLKS